MNESFCIDPIAIGMIFYCNYPNELKRQYVVLFIHSTFIKKLFVGDFHFN